MILCAISCNVSGFEFSFFLSLSKDLLVLFLFSKNQLSIYKMILEGTSFKNGKLSN